MREKEAILVRALGPEGEGWGECVAAQEPRYSAEWNDGAWLVLRDHLAPAALAGHASGVRGHPMARTALDVALLDLRLRAEGRSLAEELGAIRDRVPSGVSLGLEGSLDDLLAEVEQAVGARYRRVKLKIEPGRDLDVVRTVRETFPDLPLSVDANAAYTPADLDHLTRLDAFGLAYIEQPLPEDDLLGHASLQERIQTPVCLDESITSPTRAMEAIRADACRIINVKVGRVGGLDPSRAIHDIAVAEGVPLWCGGMLETGIGRAVNLAVAAMPGFTLPGDTSASERYFPQDLTEPFVLDPDGTMPVPRGPGIGVDPDPERLAEATVDRTTIRSG